MIKWLQSLPTVLLGLRSVLRGDTNVTIAQMIHGKSIRLRGEFFEEQKTIMDPETFDKELQKRMEELKHFKIPRQASQNSFVRKGLHITTHVFIRIDRVNKPLESGYHGPFPVVKRY